MSVPTLKAATPSSIRPYTSPSVRSNQLFDVMNSTDRNNNDSDEHTCQSPEHNCLVLTSDNHQSLDTNPRFEQEFRNFQEISTSSNISPEMKKENFPKMIGMEKIRPASSEFCNTGIPLLKRFQSVSVSSDEELGHENLTLTLSDEHLPVLRSTVYDLQNGGLSPCIEETSFIESPSSNVSSNWQELNIKTADAAEISCDERIAYLDINVESSLFSSESSTVHSERFHDLVTDVHGLVFSESTHSLCRAKNKSSDKRMSKHTDDLFLEDLEIAEDDYQIGNISIAYPSSLNQKSLSLQELNSLNEESCTEANRKTSFHSFVNLIEHNDLLAVKSQSYSSLYIEKEKETETVTLRRKNNNIQGKYIKNKSKRGAQKVLKTVKQCVDLSTNNSDCQSLLSRSDPDTIHSVQTKKQNIAKDNSADIVTRNPSSLEAESNQSVETQSPILNGSEVVLLVVGGERDNQILPSEAISLWKCLLY